MTKKITFVCHAGKSIGLGHLSRIVSISNHIQHISNKLIEIVVINITTNQLLWLKSNLWSEIEIVHFKDWKFIPVECLWLITDIKSKEVEKEVFSDIKNAISKAKRKIAIDDDLGIPDIFDFLFFPSFFAPKLLAQRRDLKEKIIFGWDCILLQKYGFNDLKKGCDVGQKSLLVLSGGSNSYNTPVYWKPAIEASLKLGYRVDYVVGPDANFSFISSMSSESVKFHFSPSNLEYLYSSSNVCLCMYGISFYEALSYRIPSYVCMQNSDMYEIQKVEKLDISRVSKKIAIEFDDFLQFLVKDVSILNQRKTIEQFFNLSGVERFFELLDLDMH